MLSLQGRRLISIGAAQAEVVWTGERALVLCVLVDAIEVLRRGVARPEKREKQRGWRRQVEGDARWVLEESDWPYSFRACCEALGLDADALREQLRREGVLDGLEPAATTAAA